MSQDTHSDRLLYSSYKRIALISLQKLLKYIRCKIVVPALTGRNRPQGRG